ncbi:MAG: dTDP-4-dehydrorhamnose 3,5-epimerase family protein, partial [Flavobacteriia bacterium]|nr:dTDP-4-dehydrorhamnose 3,5-epimerase family protein [Flavobacteriia bacterium]
LYNKESEAGIYPLDKSLAIDWQIPREEMIISEKDRNALPFSEIQSFLK